MYGTGGGPAKKFDDTSMDNDMKQILGSQMTGFESEFDNDKENIEIEPENVLLIVEDDGNDDEHGSFVEKGSKKKDTGILEDITDAHRDGTNLDRDKQEMKIKHMEEKHKVSLQQEQECHEQKIRMNQEEHAMKLQILRLQRDKLLKDI
ncbi:hypothetical protein NQ314_018448 [Rhamnusium bicolor]|uniref:Uncharacterized protein n=1 Tax=Rhamnusium bicolor TaxID=1586634 RepID=A0AAV8WQP6_9CUCU|nr:hypothetical protein NQ314_018448 [Rhamnusium bicolor]